MLNNPNPALNKEEVALLVLQPEECFRRAVQRGAISLDQVTESLSPHVAAAVRSVVTGERPPAPSELFEEMVHKFEQTRGRPLTEAELEQIRGFMQMQVPEAHETLAPYPHLQHLLDEQMLNGGGAISAANAIDRVLGRYLTGTLYAAP
jgi:predicted Zn-dependent peptidase